MPPKEGQPADLLQTIQNYIATKGVDFLINLVVFLVILFIGYLIIKTVVAVAERALRRAPKISEILRKFLLNVIHKVLWIMLIMMALPRLGVNVSALVAGLGVGGFIVGFAFQESLGNFAAGIMLLLNQPYKLDDFVEISGVAGKVKDMNIMATTIVTPDNKRVTVPNRRIWGTEITNYSALPTRRVDLMIGIHYCENVGNAIKVLEEMLAQHPQVLKDPKPTVAVREMADSSVNLVVRPWCNTADYWDVYFSVSRRIKEALDAAGVQIPFPQMDVHVKDMPRMN